MSAEVQLRTALLASATLAGLIGNRLYPSTLDQGAAFPAMTYQRLSTKPVYSLDQLPNPRWGKNGWCRFQFECVGDGSSSAEQARGVADALEAALKTFNLGAEPASPEYLQQAPNFILNRWEMPLTDFTPPKFVVYVDVQIFIRED